MINKNIRHLQAIDVATYSNRHSNKVRDLAENINNTKINKMATLC